MEYKELRDMAREPWDPEKVKRLIGDDKVDVVLQGYFARVRDYDHDGRIEARIREIFEESGIEIENFSKLGRYCPDVGADPHGEEWYIPDSETFTFSGNLNPENHLFIAKTGVKTGWDLYYAIAALQSMKQYYIQFQPPFKFVYAERVGSKKNQFALLHPAVKVFNSAITYDHFIALNDLVI